jgi:hypothetical protein
LSWVPARVISAAGLKGLATTAWYCDSGSTLGLAEVPGAAAEALTRLSGMSWVQRSDVVKPLKVSALRPVTGVPGYRLVTS